MAPIDALDVKILRVMGVRPFMRWPLGPHAVKPAQVARILGRSVQVVKDRIARMTRDGVIKGYGLVPNLRHAGMNVTTYHFLLGEIPDESRLGRLRAVDGVLGVLWFYGPHVCFDLGHASLAERQRRLDLIRELAGENPETLWLHDYPYPEVPRRLTKLDWRIIRALHTNARRPLGEIAREVGVTAKTVRRRLATMRNEGSIEEYVFVDYSRMTGLVPFILYVWFPEDSLDPTPRLLDIFDERWFNRFCAKGTGSRVLVLHLVAENPAETQALVRQALQVEGVTRAEPQMPVGGYWNLPWFAELLERQGGGVEPGLPEPLQEPAEKVIAD